MRISASRLFVSVAIVAGLAAEWHQWRTAHPASNSSQVAAIGRQAPDLSLPDMDGHPHRLSDYPGQRRIVNFWASWCGPCLNELPLLDRAAREQQASIIGIAMDSPAAVKSFLNATPVHYPVLLGQLQPPSSSARFDDSGGLLPFSVLLDGDGKLLARHAGAFTPALLANWLDSSQQPATDR